MTADPWSHVTFALAPGWKELPADPKRIDETAWMRWATEGYPDDDEPGGFAWMEGLVPPETRAASEAYLAMVREETPAEAEDDGSLPVPLGEVAGYLREARRLPVHVRVFGAPGPAAIAFVCRAKAPLTRVETDRLYERLVRWTGVRVNGCGSNADHVELVGDPYGTMDWGLHHTVIRQYHAHPLLVFAVARSWEALEAGLAGLDVRPLPDHPVPPPAATAVIAAPDAPPGPALAELVDAWLAVAEPAFVTFLRVKIGPATPYLDHRDGAWEYGPRGAPTARGPGALAAAIAGFRTLAREHGPPDLGSVEIPTGNLDRGHALRLYGAAIRTIAETCGIDLTPPPGHAVRPAPWASAIHPETLAVTKVAPFAPTGGLLLDKDRQGISVVTTYWRVTDGGLERVKDKRAAKALIGPWIVAYGQRTRTLPPRTTLDGTKVTFSASRYDAFEIPLSRSLVGSDPKAWVAGLGAAPPEEVPPIDEDRAPWRVELAKSGRAACRVCGQLIDAEAVRVGSPSEYEGRASFRWHHLACGAPRLRTPEKLLGFADLPADAAEEVRIALRR